MSIMADIDELCYIQRESLEYALRLYRVSHAQINEVHLHAYLRGDRVHLTKFIQVYLTVTVLGPRIIPPAISE